MMLLLWLKILEKLFTPDVGLKIISQKILPQMMSVFIKKSKETEENVLAIISVILVEKEYLLIQNLESIKTFLHQ